MARWAHHVVFGRFQLDLTEPSLWAAATRLSTTPKQLAILVHLVRNAGRLVSKEELLASIWPDCHVIDSVVKTHIARIRQVLGDTAEKPQFIETVGRQGYRFVALVEASNLPRSLASFIGREREAADLRELLKIHRLVTISGPPGVGKTCLTVGRSRLQAMLDIYNVLNSRPPQGILNTYGAVWLRPTLLLGGRLFKVGAQVDF